MIRKMNINRFTQVLIFLLIGVSVFAQCNYQLVEEAAQMAGSNTVFLRDFKVRLSEATMDEPLPTGRFPVYLNEGVNYRFTIANADSVNRGTNVELVRRGQVYVSNSGSESNLNKFDFACERSATYQLQINFGQGKEGCAAVVMSLILDDSLSYIEPGVPLVSDSLETLYLWMENEVQIATTLGADYIVNASVSQGNIQKKGNYFYIEPEHQGKLEVFVEVKDKDGKFMEADTAQYIIERPPLPELVLPNESAASISLREFTGMGDVELVNYIDSEKQFYWLKHFTIANNESGLGSITSYTKGLTIQQINFIRKLKSGDSFYLLQVQFTDSEGNHYISSSKRIFIVD